MAADWPASCRRAVSLCGWVVTARRDGSDRRPVVRGLDAHWSSDGRHLVFTLPAGGVATALASGRGVRLLGRGFEAEWSPDGRRIVYARMGPTPAADAVWVMNRDGSGAHRILRGASSPSWRPGPVPQAVGRSTSSRQRP